LGEDAARFDLDIQPRSAMGAQSAFMLEHLIDGDPESNTLSWRWVTGLHTTGKTYLANAERIREMTGGRFAPAGLRERRHSRLQY
jgi:hypothetical protein